MTKELEQELIEAKAEIAALKKLLEQTRLNAKRAMIEKNTLQKELCQLTKEMGLR